MSLPSEHMVETQVKPRGITDPLVLRAVAAVPRERFVSREYRKYAYSDCPLPISDGQTISQPFMVAAMTEFLRLTPEKSVLEIGTGCGYQTAVLAEITSHVYTVEIVENLANRAKTLLRRLGYDEVRFKVGDGYFGWREHAPFDAVIVTAAPESLPEQVLAQLKPGGRMVVPIGPVMGDQVLYLIEKDEDGHIFKEEKMPVRFVPLTGCH